jgi:ATP-binding cassette subfamily B (MDR/TAP) protein 1
MKDDLPSVSYYRLFRFADKLDYFLLALGLIFAAGNGASLIFYADPFGQLTQAFAPNVTKDYIV